MQVATKEYKAICQQTKKVPNRVIQVVVWLLIYIYTFIVVGMASMELTVVFIVQIYLKMGNLKQNISLKYYKSKNNKMNKNQGMKVPYF